MGRKIRDLTGDRFGKLLVVRQHFYIDEEDYCKRKPSKSSKGRPNWHCVCDCGRKCIKSSDSLLSGNTNSCGCLRTAHAKRMNKLSGKTALPLIPGTRYGRLTLMGRHDPPNDPQGHSMWDCLCDCGKGIVTRGHSLNVGLTRSCGCLSVDEFMERSRRYNERRRAKKAQKKSAGKCK